MSTEYRQQALRYLRENPLCHMATIAAGKPVCRLMHGGRIDDDFTIWFATGVTSGKISQLKANPHTCLSYFNGRCDISIQGRGKIFTDQATKDEHWHDGLKQYFPGGRTDPGFAVIRIEPDSVKYRDFETTGFNAIEVLD